MKSTGFSAVLLCFCSLMIRLIPTDLVVASRPGGLGAPAFGGVLLVPIVQLRRVDFVCTLCLSICTPSFCFTCCPSLADPDWTPSLALHTHTHTCSTTLFAPLWPHVKYPPFLPREACHVSVCPSFLKVFTGCLGVLPWRLPSWLVVFCFARSSFWCIGAFVFSFFTLVIRLLHI